MIKIDLQYIQAYKSAPAETKRAIVKFMQLPEKERQNKPLLYFILGAGTPPYKMDKASSKYVSVSKHPTQDCENCIFAFQNVVKQNFICSQIRGDIEPDGWCKLWKG